MVPLQNLDFEDELEPTSPSYVCFSAITAFLQALLVPRRIRSGRSSSSSVNSSVSPHSVKSDK